MKTLLLKLTIVFIGFFALQTVQSQTLVNISGDTTVRVGDVEVYKVNSVPNSSSKCFKWSITGGTFSNGRTTRTIIGGTEVTVTWRECRRGNPGISATVFNGLPGVTAFFPSYVSTLRISKNCQSAPRPSNLTCSSVQNSINSTYRYAPISASARCASIENIISNAVMAGLNCNFNNPCD